MLQVIPALSGAQPGGGEATSHEQKLLQAGGADIQDVINQIIEAYLIFDTNGRGFIRKAELASIMQEQGASNSNSLLSSDRWNEMDWDRNGAVSFEEFVASFYSWVADEEAGD